MTELWRRVARLVQSADVPMMLRDELRSEMFTALLLEEFKDEAKALKVCTRRAWKLHPDRFKVSIDAPMFADGTLTLADMLEG